MGNRRFMKPCIMTAAISVSATSLLFGFINVHNSQQYDKLCSEMSEQNDSLFDDWEKSCEEAKSLRIALDCAADENAEYRALINELNEKICTLEGKESSSKKKKLVHKSPKLNAEQNSRADSIAYLAYRMYTKYQVLPSIVVGQAMKETSLGEADTSATPYFGWWGVTNPYTGEYYTYNSLRDAVTGYLKCINCGRYKKAVGSSNYTASAMSIQEGGYCEDKDGYADGVVECIELYGFSEYDDYYLGE